MGMPEDKNIPGWMHGGYAPWRNSAPNTGDVNMDVAAKTAHRPGADANSHSTVPHIDTSAQVPVIGRTGEPNTRK